MLAAGAFGTLPEWTVVLGVLLAGATFMRGWRSIAITNLRTERDEYKRECEQLRAEVATLRATRDLAPLQQAMVDALQQHEARAQSRWEKTSQALDRHLALTGLIADRLGGEPHNHMEPQTS